MASRQRTAAREAEARFKPPLAAARRARRSLNAQLVPLAIGALRSCRQRQDAS